MNKSDALKRMKTLIEALNNASDAYYNTEPTMSDYEWDNLYNELKMIEDEIGISFPDSPTIHVGFEVKNEINKVKHNHDMLSLDKCHSAEELQVFAKDKDCILSMKMDGLTMTVRYLNGKLVSAESRGNGIEGNDVLSIAKTIKNLPLNIPYKDELIVDGEVIIDYKTFHEINNSLPDDVERYKHPRNLAGGTLNLLDSEIAAKRNLKFISWRCIKGFSDIDSMFGRFGRLSELGFTNVPYWTYANGDNLVTMLNNLRDVAEELGYPYDGAVMSYDSIEYGESLGRTEKFFRHSIAYKYEDQLFETTLLKIEWNTSKTGLVNPVAIFEPVTIDGTEVQRATLHNVSFMENLQLGIGDTIQVYKANMIIPKVHDNLTRSNTYKFPETCPCCNHPLIVQQNNESKTLVCKNQNCQAQVLSKFVHFVSRNAMNIEGLSGAKLEKIMSVIPLYNFSDLYMLKEHYGKLVTLEGLGEKSIKSLLAEIEDSKVVKLENFIYALSIPNIGRTQSKIISRLFHGDYYQFERAISNNYDFTTVEGFGNVLHQSIHEWFSNNYRMLAQLADIMDFQIDASNDGQSKVNKHISNKTFVITGKLNHFESREKLKDKIELLGGKVSSSVSNKTDFLVNNDMKSTSGKNRKAIELGVPIINEDELIKLLEGRVV